MINLTYIRLLVQIRQSNPSPLCFALRWKHKEKVSYNSISCGTARTHLQRELPSYYVSYAA